MHVLLVWVFDFHIFFLLLSSDIHYDLQFVLCMAIILKRDNGFIADLKLSLCSDRGQALLGHETQSNLLHCAS